MGGHLIFKEFKKRLLIEEPLLAIKMHFFTYNIKIRFEIAVYLGHYSIVPALIIFTDELTLTVKFA